MKYEQTQLQIKKSLDLLKEWNCLAGLTDNEKLQIATSLRDIASTAIMDTKATIDNTLEEGYHNFRNIRPIFLLDDPLADNNSPQ